MKVEVSTTVDICEKVHVSMQDITAALADYETEVERAATINGISSRTTVNAARMLISAAYQCIGSVQKQTIEAMPLDHREIVADALAKESRRFRSSD